MKTITPKLAILSIFCSLTLACAQPLENPKLETPKEQPALEEAIKHQAPETPNIHQRVSSIVQLSCQLKNQCKTIGVGVSPCGGYAKHFVYSTDSTNVKKLSMLVKDFNQKQTLNNKKNELVGICRFISPPKTACVQHRCLTVNNSLM